MHFKHYIKSTFLFLILIPFWGNSQEKAVIVLKQADKFIGEKVNEVTINFLSGDVILVHDSTTFYCDSAELNRQDNNFKAFGNIKAVMNDSIELYGDRLTYDGNTKITHVFDSVRLVDDSTTLYTDYLIYYRIGKKGIYNQGGTIVDGDNVLVSKIGEYYTNLKEYQFKKDVVVTTPDYVINADTLNYNTETEIIDFNGYTTLKGKDDFMFAFKGWSDTRNNITSLKKHATVQHKHQIIYGDSVYYEKDNKYGYATRDAVLMDTKKNIVVEGQIVEYIKQKGYAYATDSAFAVIIDKTDSLFLHSDTLKMILDDSTGAANELVAYNSVKYYREDIQGACDSLIYDMNDSIISMYQEPVLWSEENQLTSDSMKIFMTNQLMDSLVMYNSAFIISVDSTETYNQIKGRNVIGYFDNNELYEIKVIGNSETVYYIRDEETRDLIGINKAIASNMLIKLEDKQIVSIKYIDNPNAVLYPEFEITLEDRILKGFKWLHYMRPRDKFDIFSRN